MTKQAKPSSFSDLVITVETSRPVNKSTERALAREADRLGLNVGDYLFVHPADLDELLRTEIEELLWAFSPEFLASETGLPVEIFKAIQSNEKCDDNNPAVRALVDATCGLTQFAADAVQADGAGHFLAGYDCNEWELSVPRRATGQRDLWTAYRTN